MVQFSAKETREADVVGFGSHFGFEGCCIGLYASSYKFGVSREICNQEFTLMKDKEKGTV